MLIAPWMKPLQNAFWDARKQYGVPARPLNGKVEVAAKRSRTFLGILESLFALRMNQDFMPDACSVKMKKSIANDASCSLFFQYAFVCKMFFQKESFKMNFSTYCWFKLKCLLKWNHRASPKTQEICVFFWKSRFTSKSPIFTSRQGLAQQKRC